MNGQKKFKIAVIAGEPSGDQLGGAFLKALKVKLPHINIIGIGGPAMQAQGLVSLFPMEELSLMGFWSILKNLPRLFKRLHQTLAFLKAEKPDILITIDAPEFSFRVAQKLQGQGIKLVHYTAPTVWAWRPGRAKKIAQFLDHLLTTYPFENPYFEKYHLPTTFVGHAVVEKGIDKIGRQVFRTKYGLGEAKILTLMPGSRRSEVSALLPVFKKVVERLATENKALKIFLPVVSAVKESVLSFLQDCSIPVHLIEEEEEKYELMRASTAVLAASGTVNLELLMANVPFVITYRVSPFTAWCVRQLLHVPYVTMVNIIENRAVVPELLQENCTASQIYQAIHPFLYDDAKRRQVQRDLKKIAGKLCPEDTELPSQKAADVILEMLLSEK